MEMEQNQPFETLEQQKLKCADKLLKIKEFVSSKDRDEAEELFGKNERTIIRYLQGKVANVDFGVQLYGFFLQCIEKRQKQLS